MVMEAVEKKSVLEVRARERDEKARDYTGMVMITFLPLSFSSGCPANCMVPSHNQG